MPRAPSALHSCSGPGLWSTARASQWAPCAPAAVKLRLARVTATDRQAVHFRTKVKFFFLFNLDHFLLDQWTQGDYPRRYCCCCCILLSGIGCRFCILCFLIQPRCLGPSTRQQQRSNKTGQQMSMDLLTALLDTRRTAASGLSIAYQVLQ